MKINIIRVPEEILEDFADKHGLTMQVVERENPEFGMRFYANFIGVEVKEGSLLSSTSGNGDCPDEAIMKYAWAISHKHLVKDAYRTWRKEMLAPKLKYYAKNGKHDK